MLHRIDVTYRYTSCIPCSVSVCEPRMRCHIGERVRLVLDQGTKFKMDGYTGATWQMQLNNPCTATMQPQVKLLL